MNFSTIIKLTFAFCFFSFSLFSQGAYSQYPVVSFSTFLYITPLDRLHIILYTLLMDRKEPLQTAFFETESG